MGVSRRHILSRKQGSSTAEVWVADGKVRPHGGYVNFYFSVPGALLGPALPVCGVGSPAASSRVLFVSKEGEQRRLGTDLVWGLQKPVHEDHVSFLWESGGNGRRQLPALASLQPSGVTQLSWPTCAVLSWRRKS